MTCPHRACRTNIGGIKKTRLEKGQKDADRRPIPVSSQGLRHATVEHLTLPDTIIREPEKNPNPFRPTVVSAAEEEEIRDEHRLCTTSGHASSRVIQKGSSEKTSSLSPSERSERRFCENCRLGELTCLMLSVHVGFAEDRVSSKWADEVGLDWLERWNHHDGEKTPVQVGLEASTIRTVHNAPQSRICE
jgi:hypothetical protein